MSVRVHISVCVRTGVSVRVCPYGRMHVSVRAYVRAYVRTDVRTYVSVRACACVRTGVCICPYVRTYVSVHAHARVCPYVPFNAFFAQVGQTSDFAPLSKKALTFHSMRDSNLQESKVTFDMYNVEDVLFRRHFNAQPLKPALSFLGDDKRGTIARGFAKEGKDICATLQAALDKDPDTQPAVVVVDPFSTGAIVAKGFVSCFASCPAISHRIRISSSRVSLSYI